MAEYYFSSFAYDSSSLNYEVFSAGTLWALCASHSKHLSNNFVWEMMVHSSLYLRIPVGLLKQWHMQWHSQ
jgi:hypothetical protein